MEGVVATTLQPYTRQAGDTIEIQYQAYSVLVECLRPPGDRKRRRTSVHGHIPTDYGAWAFWVDAMHRLAPRLDAEQVHSFLRAAPVVDLIDASDGENDEQTSMPTSSRTRVTDLESEVQTLKQQINTLTRANRRLRVLNLQQQADGEKQTDSLVAVMFKPNQASRYFSARGGMAMAVRKMISGISAKRFGISMNMDVDKTTVIRWEMLYAASVQAHRKAWYRDRESMLYAPLRTPAAATPRDDEDEDADALEPQPLKRIFRFATHLHRGDATNTTKFKNKSTRQRRRQDITRWTQPTQQHGRRYAALYRNKLV